MEEKDYELWKQKYYNKFNVEFFYTLNGGLNQPFVNLECLQHKKKITIVWSGDPIIECNDEKCINSTVKNYWKNHKQKNKKIIRLLKFKSVKRKVNKILQNIEPDYDGYIAINIIKFLLKLNILEERKESLFQYDPLLRVRVSSEGELRSALSYLINNLNATFMNCCVNCRFDDEKKIIMENAHKNEIFESIINIILNKYKHHGEWHEFSRELELSLRNYNILVDNNRFQNIVMEKYRVQALRRFNYISLSMATIFSITSLLVAILK